ncbi:MAG: hypothetical protein GWP19_07545 [Planctomycetia bacterium]|nr:hypothetical protein [Planctomycetia bacterium]
MKRQVREWTEKDLPYIQNIALTIWLNVYSHIFSKIDMEKYHQEYYNDQNLIKSYKS